MPSLKISARNAGQVELEKFCPRCAWYLLKLKKMPFQMGMPGVMFYLEQAEKAWIYAYLSKFDTLPGYLGPFADCTKPVDYPYSMSALHKETGVEVTAQVDMMLRRKDGDICLLDLKTSKVDGGGRAYLPQYEIQVIGYSWVAEAANVGKVSTAGLLYCDIQVEAFKQDPLKYKTDTGMLVPFDFKAHEVELDYSRVTRCLKTMDQIWKEARPPKGADNCKDCALLTRLIDFDNGLRMQDHALAAVPDFRYYLAGQDYYRRLTHRHVQLVPEQFDPDGGMWANWDFS